MSCLIDMTIRPAGLLSTPRLPLDLFIDPARQAEQVAIPRPIFVDSAPCDMAQLPDMVAFLVAKNHRAGMSETLERLHALLLPHMSHIANIRAE